jgi:hypothetical protein
LNLIFNKLFVEYIAVSITQSLFIFRFWPRTRCRVKESAVQLGTARYGFQELNILIVAENSI